jgi:hypothetical protein
LDSPQLSLANGHVHVPNNRRRLLSRIIGPTRHHPTPFAPVSRSLPVRGLWASMPIQAMPLAPREPLQLSGNLVGIDSAFSGSKGARREKGVLPLYWTCQWLRDLCKAKYLRGHLQPPRDSFANSLLASRFPERANSRRTSSGA